jgi:hypothetical protein
MKYRRHPYGKITSSCEKFKNRAQVFKKEQKKSRLWRVGILNYSTIQITMSLFELLSFL